MEIIREIENMEVVSDRPCYDAKISNCGTLAEGEFDGIEVDPNDPYPFSADEWAPLQVSEKLEIVNKIRTLGNTHFTAGEFSKAVSKYNKCLSWASEEFPSPAEQKDINAARIPVLLNRAACFLKLSSAKQALEDCDAVLKLVFKLQYYFLSSLGQSE